MLGKLTCAPANVGTVLTRQLAQFPLVDLGGTLRGQRTRLQVPLQAYRTRALSLDAKLGAVVAPGLVLFRVGLGTLGRHAVTLRELGAVGLRATHLLVPRGNELALVVTARSLARAAISRNKC